MTYMKKRLFEYLCITLGTLLIAAGIYFFKFPNRFSMGGTAGIVVILYELYNKISMSTYSIFLNLAMFLAGLVIIGKAFSIKTAYCSVLLNVFLFLFEKFIPISSPTTNQPVLELCFAVMFSAAGSAVLFYFQASSGGTDIIAMIVKKYTSVRIAGALFCVDLAIALSSCMFFGIQTGLFSVLGLIGKAFIMNKFIDTFNQSQNCVLITSKADVICHYITANLHKGVTVLDCTGGFTGKDKKTLITVLKASQAEQLKSFVKEQDNEAFLIVTPTSDISGRGFHAAV